MSSEFTEVHRRRSQKSYVKVDGLDQDIENDAGEEATQATRRRSSQEPATRRRSSQEPFRRRSHEKAPAYQPVTTTEEEEDAPLPDAFDKVSFGDYCSVLQRYPYFRAYLISHLCQHIGDWFVRIASLLVVEELGTAADLGGALAKLVMSDKLVRPLFCSLGGLLADRMDRRQLMIVLDIISGVVVLGYLVALQYESLHLLYAVTTMRSAIGAMYYPATTGMVPLLVPEPRDLKIAITLNGFAWCSMAVLGGLVVGAATAVIGLRACYIIDSVSYFVSAITLLVGIHGSFDVSVRNRQESEIDIAATRQFRPIAAISDTLADLRHVWKYLVACGFGICVLMKASASATWAPEDIVGVLYTDVEDDEAASSLRMGYLFTTIGIGNFLGPLLVNNFTDAKRPVTVQRAFLFGLCLSTLGWIWISFSSTLEAFLIGTLVRTMGTGMEWMNSTLILQTLADESILGRVLSVEYAAYVIFEAMVAMISGEIHDAGVDKQGLARFGAAIGATLLALWSTYHYIFKGGAAQPRFNGTTEDAEATNGVELSVVHEVFHDKETVKVPKLAAV